MPVELVGNEDDDAGKSISDNRSTLMKMCEVHYTIEYLEGDYTSHGYGNRLKLQNIFKKYLNITIPEISGCWSSKPDLNLIKPPTMSEYCTKLLENKNEYDLENMEDRIKWIKELSDKGYYVSYDVI